MPADAARREALLRLAAATAEAIAQALEGLAPGKVKRGDVSVLPEGSAPFATVPFPALATSASYLDGVSGGNVFVMSAKSARGLTDALGAGEGGEDDESPEELELPPIHAALNETLAVAGGAISLVLGDEVGFSPPETRMLENEAAAEELLGGSPHLTSTTFLLAGQPCRLIQLVPVELVSAMIGEADDLPDEPEPAPAPPAPAAPAAAAAGGPPPAVQAAVLAAAAATLRHGRAADPGSEDEVGLVEALGDIRLRIWAEIGRTRLPLGRALELPPGAVIELDRAVDDPVDVFVNGLLFARGSLAVTDDGDWAIRLSSIEPHPIRG